MKTPSQKHRQVLNEVWRVGVKQAAQTLGVQQGWVSWVVKRWTPRAGQPNETRIMTASPRKKTRAILDHLWRTGDIRATAKHFGVQPNQIYMMRARWHPIVSAKKTQ